jgi:hypothetical protein
LAPLVRARCSPNEQEAVDDFANRPRTLGTTNMPGAGSPAARRVRKCLIIVFRSEVITMRSCRAASSSSSGSGVCRRPAVFTSKMSMAGSRVCRPRSRLASTSSSARKRMLKGVWRASAYVLPEGV